MKKVSWNTDSSNDISAMTLALSQQNKTLPPKQQTLPPRVFAIINTLTP